MRPCRFCFTVFSSTTARNSFFNVKKIAARAVREVTFMKSLCFEFLLLIQIIRLGSIISRCRQHSFSIICHFDKTNYFPFVYLFLYHHQSKEYVSHECFIFKIDDCFTRDSSYVLGLNIKHEIYSFLYTLHLKRHKKLLTLGRKWVH